MPDYRLSAAAERDLTDIYHWTCGRFGPDQADRYFESLHDSLLVLTHHPELGRSIDPIRTGYRRKSHGRHCVYYRVIDGNIMVVRILGPGQSVESAFASRLR